MDRILKITLAGAESTVQSATAVDADCHFIHSFSAGLPRPAGLIAIRMQSSVCVNGSFLNVPSTVTPC
jgi:hypothetical protein